MASVIRMHEHEEAICRNEEERRSYTNYLIGSLLFFVTDEELETCLRTVEELILQDRKRHQEEGDPS